jgi:radical SAM superfamily enzyme YgiQ (UPF0313 family)
MPRALLVYPKNPVTFWSYDETLKLINKRSVFPPLGLATIAGMLPAHYEVRLIDSNIEPLRDEDITWADVILTSSMIIHWRSLEEIIARANRLGTPVLNGGPLPTQYHEEIAGEAVFYLGEAENGFIDLVEEMVRNPEAVGRRYVDRRGQFKSLKNTPLPRWDLIDFTAYSTMVIQITRGCPESCTFCNIPALYGNETRLKEDSPTTRELDALYDTGWRGMVMVVDDNLVGNRVAIRKILEEEVIPWQEERGYPFQMYTQVSIRLADDLPLVEAMATAGFDTVFIGIESPSADSLKFMGAQKNLQGDKSLIEKIRVLQSYGFQVQAGFIVGLDTDPPDIADQTIQLIQEAGIPTAMAGILGVLPDTPDYRRYQRLGRLVEDYRYTGDSGLFNEELSFVPNIDPEELFARHRKIIETIAPHSHPARVVAHPEPLPLALGAGSARLLPAPILEVPRHRAGQVPAESDRHDRHGASGPSPDHHHRAGAARRKHQHLLRRSTQAPGEDEPRASRYPLARCEHLRWRAIGGGGTASGEVPAGGRRGAPAQCGGPPRHREPAIRASQAGVPAPG